MRLCRFAFKRLRYLCFDIFFRRFLINEPMQKPHKKGGDSAHRRAIQCLGQTKPEVSIGSLITPTPSFRKASATRSAVSDVAIATTEGPAPERAT